VSIIKIYILYDDTLINGLSQCLANLIVKMSYSMLDESCALMRKNLILIIVFRVIYSDQ